MVGMRSIIASRLDRPSPGDQAEIVTIGKLLLAGEYQTQFLQTAE